MFGHMWPGWLGLRAAFKGPCCCCREGVMWPSSARQDPFAEYHSLISLQQRLQAAISAALAEVG